jgi:hypothetical protein
LKNAYLADIMARVNIAIDVKKILMDVMKNNINNNNGINSINSKISNLNTNTKTIRLLQSQSPCSIQANIS